MAIQIENQVFKVHLQSSSSTTPATKSCFADLVRARHSTRLFHATPVPARIIHDALSLAQQSPSNSNVQPWRLVIATNAARDRLVSSLLAAARSDAEPAIPPLPAAFDHYRSAVGAKMYGQGMGIARDDPVGQRAAVLRNWEFFGAPVAAIVCIDRALGGADVLSVGLYLQTLMLALKEDGVDTCLEVSIAGYPEVVRREMGIGEDMDILCGLAIGYEDREFLANRLRMERESVEHCVRFVEE
ncbi:hypothetical protein MMC25_003175 [Agyrium rufum]|nr:hypothetical protein [Agyrium rufum]